jgi:hypothetical protein
MEILGIFIAVVGAGCLLLAFGPVGLRTYIKGAIVTAVPVIGEILNYVGALDLSKFIDAKTASAVLAGVGVLIIIFNDVNKRLYGDNPKV